MRGLLKVGKGLLGLSPAACRLPYPQNDSPPSCNPNLHPPQIPQSGSQIVGPLSDHFHTLTIHARHRRVVEWRGSCGLIWPQCRDPISGRCDRGPRGQMKVPAQERADDGNDYPGSEPGSEDDQKGKSAGVSDSLLAGGKTRL